MCGVLLKVEDKIQELDVVRKMQLGKNGSTLVCHLI